MIRAMAVLLLGASPGSQGEASVARESMAAVAEATLMDLGDLELVYEGAIVQVGGESLASKKPEEIRQDFQGLFAWKYPNICHMFVYVDDPGNAASVILKVTNLIDYKVGRRSRTPDYRRQAVSSDSFEKGMLLSLDEPRSMLRIFRLPELLYLLRSPQFDYEFLGWVEEEGRRLASAKFRYKEARMEKEFLVDLERGANPVRKRSYSGPGLRAKVDRVRLANLTTKHGSTVWIPSAGTYYSYSTRSGLSETPIFEENYSVVDSTVRSNQGLGMKRFSLDWTPTRDDGGIARMHREFERSSRALKSTEPATQPAEEAAAAIDGKAGILEAVPPSRSNWASRKIWSLVLGGLAAFSLVAAFLARRAGA